MRKMLKTISLIMAALCGAALLVAASRPVLLPATPPAAASAKTNWNAVVARTARDSHLLGNPNAPIKLVEYISYTCPHCAAFEKEGTDTILLGLVRPGKASMEFRPLLRNAVDAAATLMVNCGNPNRFQGNHAAVLRNQEKWLVQPSEAQVQRWATGDLPSRLRAIASDMSLYPLFEARGYTRVELDRCLADEQQLRAITAENQAAQQAGVESTPTFLINGQIQQVHAWSELRPLLDAATQ